MSDLWSDEQTLAAARAAAWTRPAERTGFTATQGERAGFTAWSSEAVAPPPERQATILDPDALREEGYAAGLAEGRRTVEREVAAERDAVARMIETLECLRPEPPAALAQVLGETVMRLVRQIVGEVNFDEDLLHERVAAMATLIVEEAGPARLHLSPHDVQRVETARPDIEIVADPMLRQGMIRVETGTGWIEDGPEVRLAKLRQALDRMGA